MAFCKVPGCDEEVSSRGVCSGHYQQAYRLVEKGKTTWAKLEKSGKVGSSNRIQTQKDKDWFLEEKKKTTVRRIHD